MAQIVLITNAWGPKHGGINSFNTDFAKALSAVLTPHTRVTCVAMQATAEDVEDAAKAGVKLLSLEVKDSERVDKSRAINVLDAVRSNDTGEVLWWVGHDVISGGAAVALPTKAGQGRSAVIHHMSYFDYTAYKQGNASAAKKKREEQRYLFQQADEVFAVGPLLRDSLSDLLDSSKAVRMLVPGLAEIEPVPSPKTFSAITFGRLDPENDRVKQGRLAIAGFAIACRKANEDKLYPKILRDNPRLLVIGAASDSDEEKKLHALCSKKAGRILNLLPLPYEDDRAKLFGELKRCSIAMMLSWHEGFGLTGWEAIAAEVPLIVSRKSGLYKLIDEKLGAPGLACLKDIDVRGELGDLSDEDAENFHPDDEKDVSQALLEIASELDQRKKYAKTLRTLLSEKTDGYTWPNAARGFAEALGLSAQVEIPSKRPSTTAAVFSLTSSAAPTTQATPTDETTPADQSLIKLPEPSWDRERGHGESQLLRPEEACVPFHESRRQLLDKVLAWATSEDGLAVEIQFRIGSAGAGKTRLMIEVCKELVPQGWNAGFLTSTHQQELEKPFKKLLTDHSKTFVVVDYAETRRREVVELMRAAFEAPKQHRTRIVLLARDTGDWWDRLATDHPSLEKFLTGRVVRGPYRIPEIPVGEQNREIIFREALAAFASRLNRDCTGLLLPDLSAPHFANVLFIHLAAMASLFGERPETATSLLEALLRHERRYWHEAARAQGLSNSLTPGIDQAVAMITLRAGAKNATEARHVLESVPRLRGARPEELDRILEVLRIFYPVAGGIDALRPDILGERLISQELSKDDAPLEVVLGKAADEAISRSALTVLNRLARQSPSDVIWLQRGLQHHLTLRANLAITVAIESGDPIGKVLAEALEKAPATETWDLVEPLRNRMPYETFALRECALVLTQFRLKRLSQKGNPIGNKQKIRLAGTYYDLGDWLGRLGRHREAIAAYEQARPILQNLANSDPDHATNLAGMLTNLSSQLAEIHQYKEALQQQQESVNILRKLTGSRTGSAKYRQSLAAPLNNLSMRLRENGHFVEAYRNAMESLQIRRALEKTTPGRFRRDVASSLANTASALAELGRYEEAVHHAQEAAALWHDLAETNPDAHQPSLAVALIILTQCLSELGRYKQASKVGERALQITRELARFRPDAFRNQLGSALGSLAVVHLQLGQPQKSLQLASDSLKIQKTRVDEQLTIGVSGLAFQHLNMALALRDSGSYHEAIPHANEGLSLLRTLIQELPKAFSSNLVLASTCLAHLFALTGRLAEAREVLAANKPLCEELRQGERTRADIPIRAEFLAMLALVQLRLNELQDSADTSCSATELFEESLHDRPISHRSEASSAWCTRASCEAALGDTEKAQHSAARGLALLQADLVETPRLLPPWMLDVARDLIRLAGPLANGLAHAAVYDAIHKVPEDKRE
ncbi:MAG TPA: tetratricopeptide repeat protein [Archangium sp.]|nr:tetratricopeptide repeat protein [Archangium sp.]